jgi:hypothetical protein
VKIDETRNKSGGRRDVLAPFETGQPKESFDRGFPIAVPSENIRASKAELIPPLSFLQRCDSWPAVEPWGVLLG